MSKLKKITEKTQSITFLDAVGQMNETYYLVLLTAFVLSIFLWDIGWSSNAKQPAFFIEQGLAIAVLWGGVVYLLLIMIKWLDLMKEKPTLILVIVLLAASALYFQFHMTTNSYGVVMDFALCVFAFRKNFRKMLKCILGVVIFILAFAGMGLRLGYTNDFYKPETVNPGHSLGIAYPNTWGYISFLVILLIWYLYLQKKKILTLIIFWALFALNYYYIECTTIAGFSIVFPILAIIVEIFKEKTTRYENEENWEPFADKSQESRKTEKGKVHFRAIAKWVIILIPIWVFIFMLINSFQVDWWYQFYHGKLRNLAWRFIQGGLYFKHWGMPLFGNPYNSNRIITEYVQGEFIAVGILDSSFASYMIMRGMVWLCYTLAWLCFAHYKAMRNKDYAIPLIELFILGLAIMERPGLEMRYNFILLYPLARVVLTKKLTKDKKNNDAVTS